MSLQTDGVINFKIHTGGEDLMGGPITAIGKPNTVIPTKVEGGQKEIIVSDDNVQQTLLGIHTELKKANLYNEIKTDTHIKESDLED